jgi:hypothetical protein
MTVKIVSSIEMAVSKAIEDSYVKKAVIDRLILDNGISDLANRPKRFLIIRDGRYELYAFSKRECKRWEEWLDGTGITLERFLAGEHPEWDQSDRLTEDGKASFAFTGFTCDPRARRMLERYARYGGRHLTSVSLRP